MCALSNSGTECRNRGGDGRANRRFPARGLRQLLRLDPAGVALVGVALAALGIVFALVLLSRVGRAELIALASTSALALLNWLAVRGNGALPSD